MIEYRIGNSNQTLFFSPEVMAHFEKYRQSMPWHKEAGGQLFAKLDLPRISVEIATGPRKTDKRTRTSYVADRAAEQAEIAEYTRKGYQFIGDWHSHPQREPEPSPRDIESMTETVSKSQHSLRGFVLVIVGTGLGFNGLFVSVCDRTSIHRLEPIFPAGRSNQSAKPLVWI